MAVRTLGTDCACGHDTDTHDPETGQCIECRSMSVPTYDTVVGALQEAERLFGGRLHLQVDDGDGVWQSVSNTQEALEAVEAVESAWVRISVSGGHLGTLFIVNGLEPMERLADWEDWAEPRGTWLATWWDRAFETHETIYEHTVEGQSEARLSRMIDA